MSTTSLNIATFMLNALLAMSTNDNNESISAILPPFGLEFGVRLVIQIRRVYIIITW